jgi:hypothetical protein
MGQKEKDGKRFMTPVGAGLAAICFFLPWRGDLGFSGAYMASHDNGVFWLVLIAAIAIMAAFMIYNGNNKLSKAKPFVVTAAVIAFGVMLLLLLILNRFFGYGVKDFTIGYWGSFAGFMTSLLGVQFLKDHAPANAD